MLFIMIDQSNYYDPFMDTTAPFTSNFPRAKDYSNLKSIVQAFPHLESINDPNFNTDTISSDAHFYILRSSNDDNIHKAIKYHIWSTTNSGKAILRKSWQEFEKQQKIPEIYLIFTVVSSNQFVGVAKMSSNINDSETFRYWWEPCKWFGTFNLQWIFVKDVHHSKFENIKEENTPVTNLKDGTKINAIAGRQILNIFKNSPNKPSIFEYFDYMDRREDYIRTQRDSDPEFERYFAECCQIYQQNPEAVFYQRRPFYNNRRGGRKSYHGNRKPNYSYKNHQNFTSGGYKDDSNKNHNQNIFEQFTVKTENDKQKKVKGKKFKKNFGKDDKGINDFLESGKDISSFKTYQEYEEPEDNDAGLGQSNNQ